MSSAIEREFRNLRKDFPILKRKINGKPLVYLDSTATSQKPKQVIKVVSDFYENCNANVHRGTYQISEEATEMYEGVREKVRKFIGADSIEEIIFTRGATESINLVCYTWGEANVKRGDNIVTTIMEHHSNFVPWQELCRKKGAELRIAPITKDGKIDLNKFYKLVNRKTKLVAINHASNMLGTINPVERIVKTLYPKPYTLNPKVLVDAAQSVPHLPTDVKKLSCDFLAFSGHKMLGPTGVGILYVKKDVLETMPPFMVGGHMIREVTTKESHWNDIPWKFEAGTSNIAQVIGLGAAIDYLSSVGMENIRKYEEGLTRYALRELQKVRGLRIFGPKNVKDRVGVISFVMEEVHPVRSRERVSSRSTSNGVHPHDIATLLDQEGIAVRAGHHCTMPLHREALDIEASARASLYIYNTREDIDRLVKALLKIQKMFT